MYLIDTNILLEVLLAQEKSKECKSFLNTNANELHLTDFSLHSIGVILFRYNKKEVFRVFYNDISPIISIVTLKEYDYVLDSSSKFGLDFDDSYQYSVAKENGLTIVTMDKDFSAVNDLDILFL